VTVLLNDGAGGLTQQPLTVLCGGTAHSDYPGLCVGDIDNNGTTDVVLGKGAQLCIALGAGDGSFMSDTYIAVTDAQACQLLDVNRDGKLDLIYAADAAHDSPRLMLGVGDDTFAAESTLPLSRRGAASVQVPGPRRWHLHVAAFRVHAHGPGLFVGGR
jgi:hypothetical protein